MPQVKQASKQKRVTKAAIPALGAAGLTFSLLGSASASAVPTADVPQTTHLAPNRAMTLGEEEMADVSLATFHLFDKETVGSNVQVAWCALPRLSWLRLCVAAGAVVAGAAGAAAAAHAEDGAACAKFHDLTDERQNLTNCHAADRSRQAGDCRRPLAAWTIVPWSARFDEPIVLPDGGELVTLLDAGELLA